MRVGGQVNARGWHKSETAHYCCYSVTICQCMRFSNATSSDINMINLSPSKRRLSHPLNEFKFNAKSHGNPNLSRNGKVSCDVTVHNASSLHKNTNITYTSEPLQSIFHTDEQEIQQNDNSKAFMLTDPRTCFKLRKCCSCLQN